MYIVTKNGKKLPVDTSSLSEDDSVELWNHTAGLYGEDTILKPIWILEMTRRNSFHSANPKNEPLEFVAEIIYDHEPTKEEILWAYTSNNLARYDVAIIKKGVELDYEYDD